MDPNARYKVPFRQVWCHSLRRWVRATLWCHVVSRLFRYDIESLLCRCGSYGEPS